MRKNTKYLIVKSEKICKEKIYQSAYFDDVIQFQDLVYAMNLL